MRARGASLTDIVVLVVAADDGVMPQTRRGHQPRQGRQGADRRRDQQDRQARRQPRAIKRELMRVRPQPEEWGGETLFAEVSALKGRASTSCSRPSLLQAEVLELKANPKRRASGTVIEAKLDRAAAPWPASSCRTARCARRHPAGRRGLGQGPRDDRRARAPVARGRPRTPVEVLGLNEVPSAGDPVHAVKDAKKAEEIAESRRRRRQEPHPAGLARLARGPRLAPRRERAARAQAHHQGRRAGLGRGRRHALTKLSTPKVKVTVVHAGVGAITEGDVNLGVASKAVIVGFNVRPAGKAAALAESEGVEIRLYNIIYNAVDDMKLGDGRPAPATKIEKAARQGRGPQVFNITKVGIVAGCMVTERLSSSATPRRASSATARHLEPAASRASVASRTT
jgi:translation initiation factor IF-2